MTALAAVGRRYLPRGWADLARQLGIWFGFLLVYQLARGVADRNPTLAFENGMRVIDFERRANALYELTFQRIADQSGWLETAVGWTYWNSEFTVVGLALFWVYLRRNEHFVRFRNTILLANIIGLVGYVIAPTAPPRMFPDVGFADSLAQLSGLNHGSGLVQLAANPYAAMPSLHAADALIVGITLAMVCRNRFVKVLWLVWPAWVWFTVMATGNHYWLDVVGGILVALVAMAIISRRARAQQTEHASAAAA